MVVEHWLASNWWLILTLLAITIGAYVRLGSNEKKLDDHIDSKNPAPHPSCPVHTLQFQEQGETLKRIDQRLEKIDTRIYGFIRSNGFHEGDAEE